MLFLKNDLLTHFFRLFPLLASEYLYITVISIWYWLRPSISVPRELAFLIPFSTLLNCLLKNIFQIPRPDQSLHLITVYDPFGFPSGDVQVSLVFYGMLFIYFKNHLLRSLMVLIVLCIAISRIYLGVHSLADVIGGCCFGLCIIYTWQKCSIIHRLDKTSFTFNISSIISVLLVSAFLSISYLYDLRMTAVPAMAIGALCGFFVSLIAYDALRIKFKGIGVLELFLYFLILLLVAVFIPSAKSIAWLYHASIIMKYAVIVAYIFVGVPLISQVFKKKA